MFDDVQKKSIPLDYYPEYTPFFSFLEVELRDFPEDLGGRNYFLRSSDIK